MNEKIDMFSIKTWLRGSIKFWSNEADLWEKKGNDVEKRICAARASAFETVLIRLNLGG